MYTHSQSSMSLGTVGARGNGRKRPRQRCNVTTTVATVILALSGGLWWRGIALLASDSTRLASVAPMQNRVESNARTITFYNARLSQSGLRRTSVTSQWKSILAPPLSETEELDRYSVPKGQRRRRQDFTGGAFVHMGKTGGSALSILLRNGCHSWLPHPCRTVANETVVSERVHSYYHVPDLGLLPQSQHDFYLLSVRDPYDRFVSAFVYEHLLNVEARGDEALSSHVEISLRDALQCFTTLEDFVDLLGDRPHHFNYPHHQRRVVTKSCPDLVKAAFAGRVRPFHHMYFTYTKLKNALIPNVERQKLFVTRQEHLMSDWQRINTIMAPDRPVVLPAADDDHAVVRNTTHLQLPVTRDLSWSAKQRLCRALAPEYAAYHWFLAHAQNLQSADVVAAKAQSRQKCPVLNFATL